MTPTNILDTALPVTAAQSGVLLAQALDPDNPIYTVAEYVQISGPLDVATFEKALRYVVDTTDALRVFFAEDDGHWQAHVAAHVEWDLRVEDRRDVFEELVGAQQRPIDPTGECLFRFSLFRVDEERWLWFGHYHHALLDGIGMTVVERRCAEAYTELVATGELPQWDDSDGSYAYLVAEEAQYRDSDLFTRDQEFWANELEDAPEPVSIASRPPVMPSRLENTTVYLDATDFGAIQALAREAKVAWPVIITAAWALLLGRLSGSCDVVLGLPVSARSGGGTRGIAGMVSNVVPLRVRFDLTETVTEFIQGCSGALRGAVRHQRYRVEDLRRERGLLGKEERLVGPHVNMVLETMDLNFAGAPGSVVNVAGGPVDDLSLVIDARCGDGGVNLVLGGNVDLYALDYLAGLGARLVQVIRSFVEGPQRSVASIDIVTPEEFAELTDGPNMTTEPRSALTLVDLLVAQARATPNRLAVRDDEACLTYAEWHARAAVLARILRIRGVGPGVPVVVCHPRGVDMMVAVLGVLLAGGAYVPVDPSYPAGRMQAIVKDTRPPVGVTVRDLHRSLPDDVDWFVLDDLLAGEAAAATEGADLLPEHPAYIIFTSGSTGRPKGVIVSHANVADFVQWATARFGPERLSFVLASTALNFDVSIFEMFAPLTCGGSIHVVEDLLALTERGSWRGSLVSAVPSALAEVLGRGGARIEVGDVVLAGEALGQDVAEAVREHIPGACLWNIYGPTETTVYATAWSAQEEESAIPPSIGRTRENVRAYVLDSCLRPLPHGSVGDLYLAGDGVAQGYLGRPDLTAGAFVADPFAGDGARMYRTGDLVCRHPDGTLAYLGRGDDQVKVRGFRIELGEIETVLREHPKVDQAVVVARELGVGGRALVAYVTGASFEGIDLRDHVAQRLPDYMVPAAIVLLKAMPLNANGKLDRKSLPDPEFTAGVGRGPATEAEQVLCNLFAEVLGVTGVGPDDSFLDLGGDSILAIQLANRARRAGYQVTPRSVFEARTPARLMESVGPSGPVAREDSGEVPWPVMAQLYHAADAAVDGLHQSIVVRTPAGLLQDDIVSVLEAVIRTHGAMRIRRAGDRLIVRGANETDTLGCLTVHHVAATDLDCWIDRARAETVARLGEQVVQAAWLDAGDVAGRLVITMHHLAVDGVSWTILLQDLVDAGAAVAAGRVPELPNVPTLLGDVPVVDVDGFGSKSSVPTLGEEPFDVATATSGTAWRREVTLGEEVTSLLLGEGPARLRLRPGDVLLAALVDAAAQVMQVSGSLDVDIETHGRDGDRDLSRTVGWLTRLTTHTIEAGGTPAVRSFDDLAMRVRAAGRTDVTGAPRSALCFNYLGRLAFSERDWGLDALPFPLPSPETRLIHPVTLDVYLAEQDVEKDVVGPRPAVLRAHWTAAQSVGEEKLDALVSEWIDSLIGLLDHAHHREGIIERSVADYDLVRLDDDDLAELVDRHGPLRDVLPLAPLQNGLLFHAAYDGSDDVYAVQFTFDLDGCLDVDRLRDALGRVLTDIPNLGAAFHHVPQPIQVLPENVDVQISVHDLRNRPASHRGAHASEVLSEDRLTPFDLTHPPLLRGVLVRMDDTRSIFALTIHHILVDGWSMPLLAERLFAAYAGRSVPVPRPFRDHLKVLAERSVEEGLAAWNEVLGDVQERSMLCQDMEHLEVPDRIEVLLEERMSERLAKVAKQHGLTLNSLAQGAWGVVLSAVLGRGDVLFGTTVSGRPAELHGMESMIGLFINTVPVRWTSTPADRLVDLLIDHQAQQQNLTPHHHIGLADIQRVVGLGDLFDTLFVFENYPLDSSRLHADVTDVSIEGIGGIDATHYPVTVVVIPGEQIRVRIDHRKPACSAELAQSLLAALVRVLTGFAEGIDGVVADIDILAAGERTRVLFDENDTAVNVPNTTLPAMVAEQTVRTPKAVALVADGQEYTYAEFDAVTNAWARALIRRGIGPGDIVGVAMPRCVELVLTIHAVEKAGGAYVPLDPTHPAERLTYMVETTRPSLLITREEVDLPELSVAVVLASELDEGNGDEASSQLTDADRVEPLRPEHPAYVIFTSGSTGRPKGVMVSHRAIVNRLCWMQGRYGLTLEDRVLQKTPASFDVSVWEFFWPFQVGATLVVAKADGHQDPLYLAEIIDAQRITTMHFVPSMLSAFLDATSGSFYPSLRRVLCSGEAFPANLAQRMLNSCSGDVHNLYGPTEAAVDVSAWQCASEDREIPIGHPVWNTSMYVLDQALRPCGIDVPGDLYIAGVQLAYGYIGQPGMTAERFVANPFGPGGTRMYRTGDVARRRRDGALIFLGRADHQVKIRGVRIELGEVEAALSSHPSVSGCAVIATSASSSGGSRLVAYLAGTDIDVEEVISLTSERLPEYMVPAEVVTMADLPLTSNGKLDRKALPDPPAPASVGGRVPSTPGEKTLAQVFTEVLGVNEVGADDSFFALGGDSITSIQLVTRARAQGLELTPRQVFEQRTVTALARVAGNVEKVGEELDAGIGMIDLTPFGRWLFEEGGEGSAFHQAMAVVMPSDLDYSQILDALTRLVDHHDALRMQTHCSGNRVNAEIRPRGTVDVSEALVCRRLDAVDDASLVAAVTDEAAFTPDLAPEEGRILRAVWFIRPGKQGCLLMQIHHLAVDAVSWEILLSDLQVICSGGLPAPVRTSFRTWCNRLAGEAEACRGEIDRWLEDVTGPAAAFTPRPLDPQRDLADTAKTVDVDLPDEVNDEILSRLCESFNTSNEHILLAGLALAAEQLGQRDAVLIDVEGHGRDALDGVDVTRTVGWFTTVRPVRLTTPTAVDTVGGLLRSIKETMRSAPGHGYGLLRWTDPVGRDRLAEAGNAPLGFNYLGVVDKTEQARPFRPLPGGEVLGGGGGPAMRLMHAVEIVAWLEKTTVGARLRARLVYPAAVCDQRDMEALGAAWGEALRLLASLAEDPDGGGMTPSDVVLVDVTQEDLDAFENGLDDEWGNL